MLKSNIIRNVKSIIKFNKEFTAILFIGMVGYFYLAIISFSPSDSSLFSASYPVAKTNNLAGLFGAGVAGFFIQKIGLLSYVIALPLIYLSWNINKRRIISRPLFFTFIAWFGLFVSLSWYLILLKPTFKISANELPISGELGVLLYSIITKYFGNIGGMIIISTVFISCLSILGLQEIPKIKSNPLTQIKLLLFKLKSIIIKHTSNHFLNSEAFVKTPASLNDSNHSDFENTTDNIFNSSIQNIIKKRVLASQSINISENYGQPSTSIFNKNPSSVLSDLEKDSLDKTKILLLKTLEEFGVNGEVVAIQPGPVVTVFEFQPEAGVKQSKVLSLVDDLALALKVESILIHPVPNKRALGIQVPNTIRQQVFFGDLVESGSFNNSESALTFALGKSIAGDPICVDLTSMPHLLIAGSTGSGKSVAVNALICSVLMKAGPDKVRMLLVDPKMLELSVYEGIPHLLMPVITDPHKANITLKWAVEEMERRYKLMQLAAVRNISSYNQYVKSISENESIKFLETLNNEHGLEITEIVELPYILIVIDELADLMLTASKEIETLIQRLAQKARASGIHLVLATQRPSVDIITGVIKANLPTRISFQVVSKHDSRTILDQMGAEKLLGKGDMLLQKPGNNKLERIQGAFVSDNEVVRVVKQILLQHPNPNYNQSLMDWVEKNSQSNSEDSFELNFDSNEDPKTAQAIEIASRQGTISASFLQRQLKIGYNRAARIIEHLEQQGLISGPDGAKPRTWLGKI